ncbi:hypothetical protein NPIL_348361 [Nephila pilipes]|uniref:Uncharacterized protein n=1 Tax=Nephila pilipes TaxID=299642 RepID=A0A8X6TRM2_NEPPI|nr:hypothetical protein NPIL_348361 [Nephila pilipes]
MVVARDRRPLFSPGLANQTGGRKRCRGVKFFWTFSSVTSSEKEVSWRILTILFLPFISEGLCLEFFVYPRFLFFPFSGLGEQIIRREERAGNIHVFGIRVKKEGNTLGCI